MALYEHPVDLHTLPAVSVETRRERTLAQHRQARQCVRLDTFWSLLPSCVLPGYNIACVHTPSCIRLSQAAQISVSERLGARSRPTCKGLQLHASQQWHVSSGTVKSSAAEKMHTYFFALLSCTCIQRAAYFSATGLSATDPGAQCMWSPCTGNQVTASQNAE